ncbi:MAG TPA: hypothetical protein VGF33_03785 [Caulobacteraceae bacterium]|jgi:hypothetical protein
MTYLRIVAATVGMAIALPAVAQTQSASPPPYAQTTGAPSADTYGVNTRMVTADQIPPAQAQALAAGDNKLVTNGPVPDTPANRAKYGGPMSNGGRRTAPVGN